MDFVLYICYFTSRLHIKSNLLYLKMYNLHVIQKVLLAGSFITKNIAILKIEIF